MAHTEGSELASERIQKSARRSPDWSLQLDSMKSESLVIVDQNATVNTFPGLVHTARHTARSGLQKVGSLTFSGDAHHFVVHDWGEVVTR